MKIFVTGGTGFIGSHLIDSLLARGDNDIFALVRDPLNLKWLEGLNIHHLSGDLFSIPSLPKDLDYVFHLAGSTKARKSADYYTVNQEGTASLFQAMRLQNLAPKRIILLSTVAAAGPSEPSRPVKEHDQPAPVSEYGRSKLGGEQEALKFKERFPVSIIRVGPVYGPRDRDFLNFFKFIKKGFFPAFGSPSQLMSVCYIKDLVKALQLCQRSPSASGDIYHIADPVPITWRELGLAASRIFGKKIRTVRFPLPLVYIAAAFSELAARMSGKPSIINLQKINEMKQIAWLMDTTYTREKLDFVPDFSLEEGLRETLDWYQSQNWL